MHEFEKISISEMSKNDMLMILEALEYTGKSTNIQAFLTLKENIIKELSILTESSEEDFFEYLQK